MASLETSVRAVSQLGTRPDVLVVIKVFIELRIIVLKKQEDNLNPKRYTLNPPVKGTHVWPGVFWTLPRFPHSLIMTAHFEELVDTWADATIITKK